MTTNRTLVCTTRTGGPPLEDAAARALVATTRGFLVVAYTTSWSLACRLLRPVVDKLAIELAPQAAVARIDGDTAFGFRREHGIAGIPQLLVFENGTLIERLTDLDDARLVRLRLHRAMRLPLGEPAGEAEHRFHLAHRKARLLFAEMTEPANRALRPHLDRVAPQLEALEARLARERAAGLLTDEEEMQVRSAAFEAAFGPIRPQLEALDRAEAEALRAYEDLMAEAVEDYDLLRHARQGSQDGRARPACFTSLTGPGSAPISTGS